MVQRKEFLFRGYRCIYTTNIKIAEFKSHLKDTTDCISLNFIENTKVKKPNVSCSGGFEKMLRIILEENSRPKYVTLRQSS